MRHLSNARGQNQEIYKDLLMMTPVELRRLDPAHNMHRFYRLDIEPDLFGGFRLLKQWRRGYVP